MSLSAGIGTLRRMDKRLPHLPRPRGDRAGLRCSDDAPFAFAVVLCRDDGSSVWTYSTLAPAERRFEALKRTFARSQAAIRLQVKYVHMDCDRPEDHRFDEITPL